jgi:hypothetical protein
MKRIQIREGDIFEVPVEDGKKYFQFICLDYTQLNSEVIRAFKKKYSKSYRAIPDEIVAGEVEFHAHTMIRLGYKMGLYTKVGSDRNYLEENIVWRDSNDYGNPEISISKNWYIWRTGSKMKTVRNKRRVLDNTEIGIVVNPMDIIHRMQFGRYDFVYPEY